MIKAIIVDFGGVVLVPRSQEEKERWAARFRLPYHALIDLLYEGEAWQLARIGRISDDEFWRRVGPLVGLSDEEEIRAFAREFFATEEARLNQPLLDLLAELRPQYKIALLSNASDRLEGVLEHKLGILDHFDLVVNSARVGLAKPDLAIYELTLERLGVRPEEAVFLDDMARNVAAAAALGIHVIHYTGFPEARQHLQALLDDPESSFVIEPPGEADYPAMAALGRAMAVEAWWSPVLLLAQYRDEESIAALCADPEYIVRVARREGQVVGMGVLLQPDPAPLHHTAELSLGVHPEHRRRGIGRALVEALLAAGQQRGVERVRGWVCEENGPARALLARLGFTEVARLPGELRRPDGKLVDVVVYNLVLRGA